MSHWKIEFTVCDKKEYRIIYAEGFSKERIVEIFNETHPKWDIAEVTSCDVPKSVGVWCGI